MTSGQLILDHVRASSLLLYHVIYDIRLPSLHCEERGSPFIFIISTVVVIRETVNERATWRLDCLKSPIFP